MERTSFTEKTSAAEKMMICTIMSLSSVFYFYEDYYSFTIKMKLPLFAAMAAAWFVCAFLAGKREQRSFPVFAFLFWNIPYMYTVYYSVRDNTADYSKPLSFLNRISATFISAAFAAVSEHTGLSSGMLLVILLAVTAAAYAAGSFFCGHGTENEAENEDNHPKEPT